MAPSKSPVFAVCGGISVDTSVAVERRGTLKTRRFPAATGLAESLYADLLWECGGGNVDEGVAEAAVFGPEGSTAEDYGDVFGGPPKFAAFSSQLSLKRGISSNGAQAFHVCASQKAECTSSIHDMNGRQGACITGEVFGVPQSDALSFSSVKFSKLRSCTETPVSSQSCHSDGDKKAFTKQKEEVFCRGGKTSATGQRLVMKAASTLSTRKESSKSDGGEDIKPMCTPKPVRKGLATMKENIQVPLEGNVSEHEASIPTSTSHSSIQLPEGSQTSTCSARGRKTDTHRNNLRVKKKEKGNDSWVTIKDFQFATEPSVFPPPSRPPPGHSSASHHTVERTDGTKHNVDDWSNQIGQEESTSDSGSFISSCTQESYTRRSFKSRDVTDAVVAEQKLRMVVEAREKAKRMVEKKLREKQRARQHKESNDSLSTQAECFMKDHTRDYRGRREKSRARYYEGDHSKQEVENERRRDKTRERVTGLAGGKYGAFLRARASELLALHDMSESLVQEGTVEDHFKSGIGEESPRQNDSFATRTSRDLHERSFQESAEGPGSIVVEDGAFEWREQQQAGVCSSKQRHSWTTTDTVRPCTFPSSGYNDTEWKSVTKSPSFKRVGSVPRTLDEEFELLSGSASWLGGFKEIAGEAPERRKARWDRHFRTAERMAKALEEKKQRDVDWQKEQAERHKAGEVLDEQIKYWAAGKEGNLEALLCSLHNVLWPECGWERVSLADLSTAAAVKKAYRRATLCVHPDKVQQKGATIAQKYIAEKVFDILKEAWVKFI